MLTSKKEKTVWRATRANIKTT